MIGDKKAQEGFSLTTLLAIIVGVVVLIIVILGFTTGFDFIFSKFDLIPGGDYDAYILGCTTAAQAKGRLDGSYCKDFKEIDIPGAGKKIINCQYPLVEDVVKNIEPNVPDCDEDEGVKYCERLMQNEDFKKAKKIVQIYNKDSNDFYECDSNTETENSGEQEAPDETD